MNTQNKLTPILAALAIGIIGFVIYKSFSHDKAPSAEPIKAVPTPAAIAKSDKSADSDSPSDTLRTLTSEVKELKSATQQLNEENARLKNENANMRTNEPALIERLRTTLRNDANAAAAKAAPDTPSSIVDGVIQSGTSGWSSLSGSVSPTANNTAGIPGGLGFDNLTGTSTMAKLPSPTNPTGAAAGAGLAPRRFVRVVPMGMVEAKSADGQTGLVKINLPAQDKTSDKVNSWQATGEPPHNIGDASRVGDGFSNGMASGNAASQKKVAKPYFTIPENATLTDATALSAIVGRVPVDGRVQDPMPFKVLIGRENLAANNQAIPTDIAGLIVSGTAIGDMTLHCSEGLIHSLTFIFNDGTVQTVSRRRDGGMQGSGSSSGTGGQGGGVAGSAKLGYLSDEFGNPCIAGRFITNAPAYLTDVIGLKTLTLAAQSAASSQTTTVATALGSSSSVTGNKSAFVMGQALGGAADEVSNWIMRRLNNSFDAVFTRAGAKVVVHIDQEIRLDKLPDARKLDYGNLNGAGNYAELRTQRSQRTLRHGLD